MRRHGLLPFAVIIAILAAMAAKSLLISVPAVRSVPGQFDAARAKARLAYVLGDQRPHPADSMADDLIRGRIVAELRHMGLEPIVRDQFACNNFRKARTVACARVRNVIAVLGPKTGKALLLAAHYDSVPVGPGASDDGVGVATLLEVESILKDRPLKRPVILLFDEGEELGLIGARAFLADPLSGDVDSLLNFEARGVTGPATMFETSQPNGSAVAAFASAVQRPFASSMMTDIYRLMPNDTDVTVLKERGWLILNFAMAGNETRYHSPGDDIAALDARSLQHMGDQALALSSELSAGVPQANGQRIFVDILGRALVQMPLQAGLLVFVILIAAFAFLLVRDRAYGGALAAVLAGIVLASLGGWIASMFMGALRAGTYWRAFPELSFVAIYATVLAIIVAVFRTIASTATREQLRIAYWFVFLVIGALMALAAPGAIIYFLGPPLIVLIGLALASRWRAAEAIAGLLALVLLYLTWGEMLALLQVLFSPGPIWIVAPVGAIVMMPALIEAHAIFARWTKRPLLFGSAAIALLAWIVAGIAPAYSANRQQRFTIEHISQFPDGESHWSVLNDGAPLPPSFGQGWRLGDLPFSQRRRWLAPAPPVNGLQAPSVELVQAMKNGSGRSLRLRLKANGAERILLIAPADAHIRSAGAAGFVRPISDTEASGKFTISCTGRSCDGAELTIDEDSTGPVDFTVVGSRNGLPPNAARFLANRPPDARPQYTPDQTVAVTHVRF